MAPSPAGRLASDAQMPPRESCVSIARRCEAGKRRIVAVDRRARENRNAVCGAKKEVATPDEGSESQPIPQGESNKPRSRPRKRRFQKPSAQKAAHLMHETARRPIPICLSFRTDGRGCRKISDKPSWRWCGPVLPGISENAFVRRGRRVSDPQPSGCWPKRIRSRTVGQMNLLVANPLRASSLGWSPVSQQINMGRHTRGWADGRSLYAEFRHARLALILPFTQLGQYGRTFSRRVLQKETSSLSSE